MLLSKSITVYVPSADRNGDPVDVCRVYAVTGNVATMVADALGGVTATDGEGYYRARNRTMMRERVHILRAWYDPADKADAAVSVLWDACQSIMEDLDQECVAVEHGGRMLLVADHESWQGFCEALGVRVPDWYVPTARYSPERVPMAARPSPDDTLVLEADDILHALTY